MALVNLTSKTVALQGYQITSPDDMMAALKYIAAGNYTGSIYCTKNGANLVWQVVIQTVGNNVSQSGFVGDWFIIQNNSVVKIVSATDFANLYTVG